MKFLKLILIVVAIGFSTNSNAVSVMGAMSCGKWVKDRAEPDQPSWGALVDSAWLVGFLSGLAVAENTDFLKSTDVDSLKLWMDNYCHEHPLKDLDDGGSILAVELKKKK